MVFNPLDFEQRIGVYPSFNISLFFKLPFSSKCSIFVGSMQIYSFKFLHHYNWEVGDFTRTLFCVSGTLKTWKNRNNRRIIDIWQKKKMAFCSSSTRFPVSMDQNQNIIKGSLCWPTNRGQQTFFVESCNHSEDRNKIKQIKYWKTMVLLRREKKDILSS